MFSIRIAIVDDLKSDIKTLHQILSVELKKHGVLDYEIEIFTSGSDFLTTWRAGTYSLIFLDIFMGNDSGVSIAQHIRKSDSIVSIIFVTASNEFASQSYEVDAAYYLHKPIDQRKVSDMLKRISLNQIARKRFIELPDGDRLLLSELIYTDKYNHCVTFHLSNNRQKMIRITHDAVEKLLYSHPEFCSIGQGTIINFDYVETITSHGFLMKNQHSISVPRRRYKEIKAIYVKYSFERAVKEGFF